MLESMKERLEEYSDILFNTNDAIQDGISKLKDIFGSVVQKYK